MAARNRPPRVRRRAPTVSKPPSWGSAYRAKKYKNDVQFRETAKERQRDNYRKRAHGTTGTVNPMRANLRSLNSFGNNRSVRGRMVLTFTVVEMADVLGRSTSIYKRWLSLGQAPAPTHQTIDGHAYRLPEARAIAHVLADHFDEFDYYRQDHRDTRRELHAAFDFARGV